MKSEKVNKNVPQVEVADPIKSIIAGSKNENVWPIEDLPSKYRLYPEGTQLFGRPLKVMEIKMLSTLNADNLNFVINDVLRRCITGFPIENLTVADKLYLIFWLRANTYKDSGYTIDFVCPEKGCKTKGKYEFELSTLKVNYISDKFDENKEHTLPSGKTVKIHAMRVSDELRVANFIKQNANSAQNFDTDLLHVAAVISEINGSKVGIIEAYDFVASGTTDPRDYAFIISYMNHFDFGVDPETPVKCAKCGGMTEVSVSFRPDFFVPKYSFE
jgi:hypothetical protein